MRLTADTECAWQDKAALEVKCRDLQAQLENVQGQRSEHRQALKVCGRVVGCWNAGQAGSKKTILRLVARVLLCLCVCYAAYHGALSLTILQHTGPAIGCCDDASMTVRILYSSPARLRK